MALKVCLEPCIDPHESIVPDAVERQPIYFEEGGELVLGRNNATGINDPIISKELVKLTVHPRSRNVLATPLVGPSRFYVHINGARWDLNRNKELILQSGDIISLRDLRYEYKVHVTHPPGETATFHGTPRVAAYPKTTGEDAEASSSTDMPSMEDEPVAAIGVSLSEETTKSLAEEIQCSVCLEVLVHPRTIDPCGHSFCTPCIMKLEQCPQCRSRIGSHVPARHLETLVETLAGVPGLLDKDDAEHHVERKKSTQKLKPAKNPFKRRRASGSSGRSARRHAPPAFPYRHTRTHAPRVGTPRRGATATRAAPSIVNPPTVPPAMSDVVQAMQWPAFSPDVIFPDPNSQVRTLHEAIEQTNSEIRVFQEVVRQNLQRRQPATRRRQPAPPLQPGEPSGSSEADAILLD